MSMSENHQVKQMQRIYSCASSVLVWLGLEDSDSKCALEFMGSLSEHGYADDLISKYNSSTIGYPSFYTEMNGMLCSGSPGADAFARMMAPFKSVLGKAAITANDLDRYKQEIYKQGLKPDLKMLES
jgi:hypothetical protein